MEKEKLDDRYDQLEERHGQLQHDHVDLQGHRDRLQQQVADPEAKFKQIQERLIG